MSFSIYFPAAGDLRGEGEELLWTCLQPLLGSSTALSLLSPSECPLPGPVFPVRARNLLIHGLWLAPPTQQWPWRTGRPCQPLFPQPGFAMVQSGSYAQSFHSNSPFWPILFKSRWIQSIRILLTHLSQFSFWGAGVVSKVKSYFSNFITWSFILFQFWLLLLNFWPFEKYFCSFH